MHNPEQIDLNQMLGLPANFDWRQMADRVQQHQLTDKSADSMLITTDLQQVMEQEMVAKTALIEKAFELEALYLNAGFEDMAAQMAMFACMCASHSGLGQVFESFNTISNPFETFGSSLLFGFEDHSDHQHCECGGHFDKNGHCEKCGKKQIKH